MDLQRDTKQSRAFLRWAGGKTWLARQAEQIFGRLSFERYHEPFLGGGAFFFSLGGHPRAYLSDKNEALIEAYQCLKNNHRAVISEMRHLKNTEDEYYRVRSEVPDCPYKRSARFIFLNQTSFNGIYRVNLKGVYNVPYGHRTKNFLDEEVLELASEALRNAQLSSRDFVDTLEFIGQGDLVFIDPPYTVSHNQNGFIKYNQSLFSLEDQYRLAQFIIEIKRRGARYILTNAAHQKVREIFDLGDTCLELSRANLIGGKQAQRGAVKELLFTNLGVL
jgi:DNA adenine methylase